MAIKIVTDSTSYIPKEYIQKYDIKIVSLCRKISIQSIGPVIGLHVGPGSIGIAYYTKR